MTVFNAIFEVNSSTGKLWDLLGNLKKKMLFILINTICLLKYSMMLYVRTTIV